MLRLLRLTRVLICLLSGNCFRYSGGKPKKSSFDSIISVFNFRRECDDVASVRLIDRDRCTRWIGEYLNGFGRGWRWLRTITRALVRLRTGAQYQSAQPKG